MSGWRAARRSSPSSRNSWWSRKPWCWSRKSTCAGGPKPRRSKSPRPCAASARPSSGTVPALRTEVRPARAGSSAMSRTVTALFDSRADAETARGRFVAQIKTRSTRIIAKDTLAAMDSLDIDPKHSKPYQDAIREGCHLLVAEVEAGQDPKQIIAQFEQSRGRAPDAPADAMPETPTYGFMGVTDERASEPAVAEPAGAAKVAEPEVAE